MLIDTGYGVEDCRNPYPRLAPSMKAMLNFQLREHETAVRQIDAMGLNPADVRHIVLTHLDFDHAGGIEDFPNARVHLMAEEWRAATGPRRRGVVGRGRYRPRQYDDVREWRRYEDPRGEPWFGFGAVRQLEGLPPEILLIPLPGHTWGHAGVAVDTDGGWLLRAGDAYFYHREVREPARHATPMTALYQTMMEADRRLRFANQARLRRLSIEHAAEVNVICAHDPVEYDAARRGDLL